MCAYRTPWVEPPLGEEAGEHAYDGLGLSLKCIDLEALMVEAIDRILEPPVARAFLEERGQLAATRADFLEKGRFSAAVGAHTRNLSPKWSTTCGTLCRRHAGELSAEAVERDSPQGAT